ncbi:hypothetical protein SISNIDRAFT_281632 [Sistotremastrum niveocremeum HHB9708]|uniref:DUF6697 domain-containing protein n=1 Tax=Sistotremastrum niveocremeum HHB9708 TaxID=1314777 RepID=A0A164Y6R6_9AGAM|nr:hypothetical protein SISNIDRAFT_281632 [Sistotremastrum niveocremeum HHB9708]
MNYRFFDVPQQDQYLLTVIFRALRIGRSVPPLYARFFRHLSLLSSFPGRHKQNSCVTPSTSVSANSIDSIGVPDLANLKPNALALYLNKLPQLKITEYPSPSDMQAARLQILSALPVPKSIPDEVLNPIIIPPPFSIYDYLAGATGVHRATLAGYRILPDATTVWCTEPEEHGYMLTPVFKCKTNPRLATTHRWNETEVLHNPTHSPKPLEYFYHKEGKWYYAGQYRTFRLADLSPKEWEGLEKDTMNALLKETLAGRRNTAPQHIYETGQLYACGALKISCIGLQCVGFNKNFYDAFVGQAVKAKAEGDWKRTWDDDASVALSPELRSDDARGNTATGVLDEDKEDRERELEVLGKGLIAEF